VGDGPAEILNEIETWAPDLVVMSRWRARAMERWMGGSVFDRVIRHVHVPVFMLTYDPERDGEPVERDRVVEGERPSRPFRILVPTRGSVWALRASELAARMLPAGTAQVRLLTVLPIELYPLPYTIEGQRVLDMPERLTRVAEAAEPAVAEPRAIFQGAGHDVDVHHRFGQPPAEILSEIKDWQPDLVVMGRWRGVSPLEWVSGSIFERVVRHAYVPVLIVK
jgi:nucleotide-binding universal stress UspA family protein